MQAKCLEFLLSLRPLRKPLTCWFFLTLVSWCRSSSDPVLQSHIQGRPVSRFESPRQLWQGAIAGSLYWGSCLSNCQIISPSMVCFNWVYLTLNSIYAWLQMSHGPSYAGNGYQMSKTANEVFLGFWLKTVEQRFNKTDPNWDWNCGLVWFNIDA